MDRLFAIATIAKAVATIVPPVVAIIKIAMSYFGGFTSSV
jgi:hypothetical protein